MRPALGHCDSQVARRQGGVVGFGLRLEETAKDVVGEGTYEEDPGLPCVGRVCGLTDPSARGELCGLPRAWCALVVLSVWAGEEPRHLQRPVLLGWALPQGV